MRRFTTGCGLAVALCLMLGTGRAQAQIAIDCNSPEPDLAPYSGPYATGTLTQAGSNVTVEVTALNSPSLPVQSPAATISEFAFNAPVGTNVTPPTGWSSSTSQSLDGFGTFNQAVSGTAVNSITFTVIGVSTSEFGYSSGVSQSRQFAVVWIGNGGGGLGGIAASPPASQAVPEPGPLLGAGVVTLMGLGYTWRRRRRATT